MRFEDQGGDQTNGSSAQHADRRLLFSSTARGLHRSSWVALGLFVLGLIFRLGLVALFPGLPVGDALARLYYSDSILLAYQLPLPQLFVFLSDQAGLGLAAQRLVFSALGASAGTAVYLAFRSLTDPVSAVAGGLIFAFNPMLLFYSSLPYQEPIMILGLAAGLRQCLRGRRWSSSVWIGLACFARFESWIAAAIFAWAALRGGERSRLHLTRWAQALAYVTVPLGWIAFRGGFAPAGTAVFDPGWELARLARIPFLGRTVLVAATPPIVVLALIGAVPLTGHLLKDKVLQAVGLFYVLFAVLLVTVGHSYPMGSALVVDREAHLLLIAVSLMAGVGWTQLKTWSGQRRRFRWTAGLMALLAAGAVGFQTVRYYRERCCGPRQLRALATAATLERMLSDQQRALVFAPVPPLQPLQIYLKKMKAKGAEDFRAAQAMVARYGRPPDFLLLALHFRGGRSRLISAEQCAPADPATLRRWLKSEKVQLVVILPEYTTWNQIPGLSPRHDAALLEHLKPLVARVRRINVQGEAVEIYRIAGQGESAMRPLAGTPPWPGFAEIARPAGLAFPGRSEGAAWGDLDGDGDYDLFVAVDGARPRLYRNDSSLRGRLAFLEVGVQWGLDSSARAFGGAWADWDGDGDSDLAVSVWPRPLLYRNDPGGLTEVGAQLGIDAPHKSQSLAWVDLEGDSIPELLIAGLDGTRLYRFGPRGAQDVTPDWGLDPAQQTVGVAFSREATTGSLMLGLAGVTGSRFYCLRHQRFLPMRMAGSPDKTFWPRPIGSMGVGVCWGDASGSGAANLFLSRFRRGNQYYRPGAKHCELQEISRWAGLDAARTSVGCAWGDVDLDGDLDLFVANEEVDALYQNQLNPRGAAVFHDIALWAGVADPAESVGCAFADADADGDLDLFVANYAGPDRLYENRGAGRSVRIRPLTAVGGAAIGALVEARLPDGSRLVQQVDGGSGFGGQNAPELLFGLASQSSARFEIRFPNGEKVERIAQAGATLEVHAR